MKDTKKTKDLKSESRGVGVLDKSKDKSISQKTGDEIQYSKSGNQPSVHIGDDDDNDNPMLATMMNKIAATYHNELD